MTRINDDFDLGMIGAELAWDAVLAAVGAGEGAD
jgi:hypothetical protein